MRSIIDYLKILTKLNTDKAHRFGANVKNQAPHKPLLLLSVVDLFARELLKQNLIEASNDLIEIFYSYWRQVMGNKKSSIAYPFLHLGNEESKFWHMIPLPGVDLKDLTNREIGRSLIKLQSVIEGAALDQDLYKLLQHSNYRNLIREVLISNYFANTVQIALSEQIFESPEKDISVSRKESTIQRLLRDSKTAKEIKMLYDYTCQICGIKLITRIGPYAEAAHIKPLGTPHNGPDISQNLLCLCPNHHSLFDLGGIIINDDYSLIIIEGNLKESLTLNTKHKINREYLQYHRNLWDNIN